MYQFQSLIRQVLRTGVWMENRTEERALSIFADHMEFDLRHGFPLVTVKKVPFQSVIAELVGFIRGVSSAADFRALGTHIWDQNANEEPNWLANPNRKGEDDLGRIYGVQWRSWLRPDGSTVDQLQKLIHGLKHNPRGRRHIVSAWNPGELDDMALPPCHVLFQCYVDLDDVLHMQMYQRSADLFLGVPFNIASYAALLCVLAEVSGLTPGRLRMVFGDIHLYESQIEGAHEVLKRHPHKPPQLVLLPFDGIDNLTPAHFNLVGYKCHPAIKVDMVV